MLIHNKKKKALLYLIHLIIEILYLPKRVFAKKIRLQEFNPKKILLLRLDHIGDVVMTSPAFSLMRQRFPHAKILLLTNGAGKQLLTGDDRIDEVVVFNWPWKQQKASEGFSWTKIKELVTTILRLRRAGIDLFVDFRGDLRFVFLFGVLTGARVRVSNSRSGKSSLLHSTSEYDISKHELERSMDVIRCFVSSDAPVYPRLCVRDGEIADIKRLVSAEIKTPYEKIAVIAPYSSRDVKSWPAAYFKDVIKHLRSRRYCVLVVGTRDDEADAEQLILEFSEGVFSFAGKTSVRQLAALVSISSLVVGVDTGVLHLASCFEVPIVAIFGSTRSVEFRPYSRYATVVESNSCRCNQFLHVKCDYPSNGYAGCLHRLPPESVIRAIDQIIEPAPAPREY